MTPKALIAPARLAGTPLLRTQTDERLVDLVRAGNDAAFEAIVARYRAPLLRYCSRLLGDGRAEDALQQTFLRAYDGLHASGRDMYLKPWLFRIAHNVTMNALRDRGSRYEELSEQIDGVERPDQAHENAERLREVVAAVGTLPARQRDAIVLRELEGRSYDEIATSLGVSDGAVRQLLNRARTTLRAGVTAITPAGLLPWAHGWGEESSARMAELCGGAAAGTLVAKACTTALLTGAIVGGAATIPQHGDERGVAADSADAAPIGGGAPGDSGEQISRAGRPQAARSASAAPAEDAESRSRRRRGSGDGSGRRRSGGDDTRSNRGPGSGDEDRGGHSGSGGRGGSHSGSGSGSSGPGSSGSGSQESGSSGSGSSKSGSPEIERSGSGTSGSGTSGSGTSGSGTSGSGTSGSGSDSPETDIGEASGSSGSGG